MTAIQNGDLIVAGGAGSQATTFIVSGGAVPATGAEDFTIQGGSSDDATFLYGQFQLTGHELTASVLPVQALESGEFTLAGESVDLTASRFIEPQEGLFELTGSEFIGARFDRTLDAETRVLVFDGFGIQNKLSLALGADAGSLALTGNPLAAVGQRFIVCLPGSSALTGNELETRRNPQITLTAGSFLLTGQELLTPSDKSLKPVAGQFQLSGNVVGLGRLAGVALDTFAFVSTGHDVELNPQNRFTEPTTGFFALTGGVLNFSISRQEVFGVQRPASRRFKPGSHYLTRTETFSGSECLRIWGTTSQDATLEVDYSNIFESTALQILQLYEKVYGGYASVALPADMLAGAGETLKGEIRLSGTKMRWYFAEPPRITAVFPGVCNVSVKFVGKNSVQR